MSDSELLALVRKHIPSAYRLLTITRWKDGIDLDEPVFGLHNLVADLLAAERAAVVAECAKVCEALWESAGDTTTVTPQRLCAFAIRKLGEKK